MVKPEDIKINFQLQLSMAGSKQHELHYAGEYEGIAVQHSLITPKKKGEGFGRGVSTFYIGDQEFTDTRAFFAALADMVNAKAAGDVVDESEESADALSPQHT